MFWNIKACKAILVFFCAIQCDINITDFMAGVSFLSLLPTYGYYLGTWWQMCVRSSKVLCIITALPQGELLLQLWMVNPLPCPAPWLHDTSSCNLPLSSLPVSQSVFSFLFLVSLCSNLVSKSYDY